jgi:PAS domain S-box-containing protein
VTPASEAGRFERFLEFAPDAIIGIGRDGRVVLANAQAEVVFGYTREELLGQPVELLIPERFLAAHPHHRDGYFGDPRTRRMGAGLELFGRRKDGSEFPVEISLSGVETEDGLMAAAAIRDVSERVNAGAGKEGQLNQLRRVESVGQLAGGIAHDFNNILGVILNYTDFVAEELGEGSPILDDVAEIKRAAERAAALTRQLLIFSRREGARPEALDLNLVVAELEGQLRRTVGERVALETRFAPELASVKADPGQVEQVLVSLAVNARDAMPMGGRLLIETENVELDGLFGELPAGAYVRLTVSDTGSGMTPEVAARAFEPFFSTKAKSEGAGLGLATVHGIVVEAGGNIGLSSDPGVGTTVKVHLPASSSPTSQSSSPAASAAGQPGRGETVLVVDDEESVRRVTERILVRAGYDVMIAATGGLALEAVGSDAQPIDLLLTDVVMPEMRGPQLVERATRIRPALRVLYMSGYIHQAVTQLGIEHPEELLFVEKPFTADQLLARVRQALDAEPEPTQDADP